MYRLGWSYAEVYWKVDSSGNLVWTKGYVARDGL
jgi:hypothetical protein